MLHNVERLDLEAWEMLEGLPLIFDYVIKMVTARPQRHSLAIVIFHYLGDIANAADHALTHYFPISLDEPYLQNSSLGTPYQKWAKFTNDDFLNLDACLQTLVPAVWQWYDQTLDWDSRGEFGAMKDAWHWLEVVKTKYSSCVIDSNEPVLTLSEINIQGWVESSEGRFLNVWNRPPWDRGEPPPPIVTKSEHDIVDRSVVAKLHEAGLENLTLLREAIESFSEWLRINYTMDDVTSPHNGTLSDYWLG